MPRTAHYIEIAILLCHSRVLPGPRFTVFLPSALPSLDGPPFVVDPKLALILLSEEDVLWNHP